jgi:hypothetical protein
MLGMSADLRQLLEKYRQRAASLTPSELYRLARADGESKLHCYVLLRDLYGYNLFQCQEVQNECEGR